ncbi:hypothetical protein AB0J86_15205 [Micromonospora sp. NPDC049559]|uniref:hypothetical protein n=1 Tax=Micromonospora sp. NPDC049559 TaxID=3155923 RepID=UPI0034423DA5
MPASRQLHKALLLLDRGDPGRGERLLRDAVTGAEREGDVVTLVTALCCLGELLIERGRTDDAGAVLRAGLAVRVDDEHEDLCAPDRRRARQLLVDIATRAS